MTMIPNPGRPLLAALLVALVAAGCGPAEEQQAGTEPAGPSAAAPDIIPVTAAGLKDEVRAAGTEAFVLNVWATWCGPCRSEFPEFVRFGQERAGEDVVVRFLSVDEADDLPRVQRFLVDHGASGRTYLTGEGTSIVADLAAPFRWTYGIPVTIIFGPDGEVRDYWEGAVTYDFLEAKVNQVLQSAGAATGGATS